MELILIIIGFVILIVVIRNFRNSTKKKKSPKIFPRKWRPILLKKVKFYSGLSREERTLFEFKILEFLESCKITGIQTSVEDKDKVLVASSAIIPIFRFPQWTYNNVGEVLLYPNAFNESFETRGEDRGILGMVGSGMMHGKMILSKQSLYKGFENESDKKNTAIHEFVHLIDKSDGDIDGVPYDLLNRQYVIPWIDLIEKKIDEIYGNRSDINPYGATNRSEFFAVISEYFFERPKLLQKKHPQLYELLEEIFNHDMVERTKNMRTHDSPDINRNDPCPCGSGLKYKKCCG